MLDPLPVSTALAVRLWVSRFQPSPSRRLPDTLVNAGSGPSARTTSTLSAKAWAAVEAQQPPPSAVHVNHDLAVPELVANERLKPPGRIGGPVDHRRVAGEVDDGDVGVDLIGGAQSMRIENLAIAVPGGAVKKRARPVRRPPGRCSLARRSLP